MSAHFLFLFSEEQLDWSAVPRDVRTLILRHVRGTRDFLALRASCRANLSPSRFFSHVPPGRAFRDAADAMPRLQAMRAHNEQLAIWRRQLGGPPPKETPLRALAGRLRHKVFKRR